MRRPHALLFICTLVLCTMSVVDAAPRRRTVRVPASTPENIWLAQHAAVLHAVEPVPYSFDLEPLRTMIGSAPVVALGDVTHGTREQYTVKHRMIEFLVREMNFDVVTLEAPFPAFNKINAYVQGGDGDARALLGAVGALGFRFWDTEEILALVEWMRAYNAQRGDRPAVHIAGMDVKEQVNASKEVVAYLRGVAAEYAVTAEQEYACVLADDDSSICIRAAERVRATLHARQAEFVEKSNAVQFHEALQLATIVTQSRPRSGAVRDDSMLANALWIREHRGTTRKMIVWAHDAHVAEVGSGVYPFPMGEDFAKRLGNDYFSIATLTASGSFLQWWLDESTGKLMSAVGSFEPPTSDHYETMLRRRGAFAFILPLNGARPEWFPQRALYNIASAGSLDLTRVAYAQLWDQFDAAIFIDTTTPIRPLP
jgi:erythromycin esterase